ncbi:MAG: SOS response-associated peptidase [Blastocatellia bacterium]
MCGRFTQHHTIDEIIERFEVAVVEYEAEPSYNIAPTQTVTAIVQNHEREMIGLQWGLIPFWAKDPKIASQLINARAETLAEKPSFKHALTKRRCLLPADGFYEWKKQKGGNQPYYIRRRDGGLFAFAGLWEEWKTPEGETRQTCTIITTEPNELMSSLHHRMPVILKPTHEAEWLDPAAHYAPALTQLLQTYPDGELEAIPVSRAVNSPAQNNPSLIQPTTLFSPN